MDRINETSSSDRILIVLKGISTMLNLANVAFLIRLGLGLTQNLLDRCGGVLTDGNSAD